MCKESRHSENVVEYKGGPIDGMGADILLGLRHIEAIFAVIAKSRAFAILNVGVDFLLRTLSNLIFHLL